MFKKIALCLTMLMLVAACTPDAAHTPTATRSPTAVVAETAVSFTPGTNDSATPTTILTTTPEAEAEATPMPVQEISAANFPALPDVPDGPLQLMDQVGGVANAVALSGDVAFVGEGLRVTAVSITDPTQPTVIGRSAPLSGIVSDIALYLDAAYIVAEPGWIDVLDVSDPAHMRRIAQLAITGAVQDIDITGNFLYVSAKISNSETTISVWDVSEMVTAVSTATATLEMGMYSQLTSTGDLLLVSWPEGIDLFDMSQPGRLNPVGQLTDFTGFAVNPVLPLPDGRLLYANEFFHQFDITNPAAGEQTAEAPLGDFLTGDDFPRLGGMVTVVGETAVILDRGYYYAPAGPSRVWTVPLGSDTPEAQLAAELPFTANDAAFRGPMGVVAHEQGMTVVEFADTAAPAILGTIEWGTAVSTTDPIAGFTTGDIPPTDFFSFDLSDLGARKRFLSLQTPNRHSAVYQENQFIVDATDGLLQYDVSNPIEPVLTAVIHPKINEIYQSGSVLFGTGSGLHTFELDEAGLMQSVAVCDDCYEGGINEIVATGLDTWHLIGQNGLYIVAIASPKNLIPMDHISFQSSLVDGLAWREQNVAYYLETSCSYTEANCAESTLWALNVGYAFDPILENQIVIPGNARKLFVFAGLLWVVTADGSLHPFDISNRYAPQPLGIDVKLPIGTSLLQTAVLDDTLYLAHPDMGILAYQLRR